jgi:hypothetical protein
MLIWDCLLKNDPFVWFGGLVCKNATAAAPNQLFAGQCGGSGHPFIFRARFKTLSLI